MGEGERGCGGAGVGEGVLLKLEEKEDEEEKDVWPVRRASGVSFTFFAVLVVCAYVGVDHGEYSN